MKIPSIKSVALEDKSYSILDFFAMTDYCLSSFIENGAIVSGKFHGEYPKAMAIYSAQKRYLVGENELFYFSDGSVRKYNKVRDKYVKVAYNKFSNPPSIFSANYKGKERIFVAADGYAYSGDGQLICIKLPDGKFHTTYKNGLYFCSGKTVFYCVDFFCQNPKKVYYFVRADEDLGEIVGMAVIGSKLFVFYEYAIYAVSAFNDGEKAKYYNVTDTRKIEKNSFLSVTNGAYFISEEKLRFFDGKNVKELAGTKNLTIVGDTQYFNGYAVHVKRSAENLIFYYDEKIEQAYFMRVGESGVCTLTDQPHNNFEWQSKNTDFGVKRKKRVKGVKVKCNLPVHLALITDGAGKFLCSHGAENEFIANSIGYEFAVRIVCNDKNARIKSVEFIFGE